MIVYIMFVNEGSFLNMIHLYMRTCQT